MKTEKNMTIVERGMGVEFIERKRAAFVAHEAKSLFDGIIEASVAMTPAQTYELEVDWQRRADVIDQMVLEKTEDMFKEMGSDLLVLRKNSKSVTVKLTPEPMGYKEEVIVKLFWSRAPGKFVDKKSGKELKLPESLQAGVHYPGTVREWYETLVETIIDAAGQMLKDAPTTLKDAPTTLYVGPSIKCILESSVLYRPDYSTNIKEGGETGTLSNRFKVRTDPSLTDTIHLVLAKDGKRSVGEVKVLDVNII
jgi:hypothetical protein